MALNFFGFQFGKNKEDKPLSFAPPALDDGSSYIEAGGLQGYFVDLDGSMRSDSDLIRKYREMSLHAEVDMAITGIMNDFLTKDANGVFVKLNTDKVNIPYPIRKLMIEEFNKILHLLDFNRKGFEIARRWYIDGRLYYHQILHDDAKEGIRELRQIDPLKIKKVKEVTEKTKLNNVDMITDFIEYYVYTPYEKTNSYTNSYEATQGLRIAPDAINYVHSGLYDSVSRRIVSHIHKAIKPLNQLRMIEDATVIYRVSRAPERRVFYIDVGSLPKVKAEQYLRDQMNRYRNKIVYDADSGELRDDKKHMSMLEDFWLPRREGGKGTEISTLPAGQNLGEMADVEYFQKKLYMALNIPITRMQADNGFNMGRSSEITRDELKFAKFIDTMRVQFSLLLTNFLKTQLLAKGVMDETDWKGIEQDLNVEFSTDSYFAESKQTELIKERMSVLREVANYSGKFFSDKWIRKNILRQTDDEIEQIDHQIEEEKAIQTAEIEAQATQSQAEQMAAGGVEGQQTAGGETSDNSSQPVKSSRGGEEQPVSKSIYDVSDLL